jgi:hypothetical protein
LVVPTEKFEPLAGKHVTVSGAVPPVAVALPKSTATAFPLSDSTAFDAGQLICSWSVGLSGPPPHDEKAVAVTTAVTAESPSRRNQARRG